MKTKLLLLFVNIVTFILCINYLVKNGYSDLVIVIPYLVFSSYEVTRGISKNLLKNKKEKNENVKLEDGYEK